MAAGVANQNAEQWLDVCALEELAVGELRTIRLGEHEVAVLRSAECEVCVLESRCPEDGQPLASGRVDGSSWICAHHGGRFSLKDGKSARGGEDLGVHPARVHEGRVEAVLPAPGGEAERERRTKTLKDAMVEGRTAQTARDIVRLLGAGTPAGRVALEVAAFDAAHNEQGAGYALCLAFDAVQVAERLPAREAALPLLQLAELAMDASKHRAARRVPHSPEPGRDPAALGPRLLSLLEADDADAADGLVRAALWRKWGRDVVEPWLFELNIAHCLGGGQGLIATIAAFDLLENVGFDHARRILPGLTYALCRMPREDLLPDWQWFRQRYAQLEPRLGELWARQGARVLTDSERGELTRVVLDGSREEAWHAVIGVLASGAGTSSVIDAVVRAAAERLWRFDPAFDADPRVSEGWIDVSQPLLYAHALRVAATRHPQPGLLKLILYAVRRINHQKPLDQPAERWLLVGAKGRLSLCDGEHALGELWEMIRAREPSQAEQSALAYLALGGSIAALRNGLASLVLRDFYARPLMAGHVLRLICAACDEAERLPELDRAWPLRAVIRMLASPVRERSLEAVLHRAQRSLE